MSVIEARGVRKRYGGQTALDGLTLRAEQGEILALLGPNGAGKTTFLEILEGLRAADAGEVAVLGHDPGTPAGRAYVQEHIGVSLQTTALFDTLTVAETLDLFGAFYKERESTSALLDRIGLADRAGARVGQLSGGQRQRVAIALALVNRPSVVFLDEPTTGLDPGARRYVWESVRQIAAEGRTIILTTHYMEEATYLSRHVAIIDRGRLVAEGTPEGIVGDLRLGVNVFAGPGSLDLTGMDAAGVGVATVERSDDGWRIRAERAEPVVEWIFGHARAAGIEIGRLEVERATLEDAFLHLTGRGLE